MGAILAAQRSVKLGRKCGHFREQAHEPLAKPAACAASALDGPASFEGEAAHLKMPQSLS